MNYSTPRHRRRSQSRISPGLQNLWAWCIFLLNFLPFKKFGKFTKFCTIWKKIMWFIDILGSAPAPPSPQNMIVPSSRHTDPTVMARATSSFDPNHSQEVVTSDGFTTDIYIEITPYDTSKSSDNRRVQKVLEKFGVSSWKFDIDGKIIVSSIHYLYPETIVNALKHEFSSNRRIKLSQKSDVTYQDKAILQAMGTMVATHASQGLIKSIEYNETTTKEGTQTRAVKVDYVGRDDEGDFSSKAAPSVPRVHPIIRRFRSTTKEKTNCSYY